MIFIDNHSKIGSYIVLDSTGYSIVDKTKVNVVRKGVGGFTEDGQLLGIYVDLDKLFFLYNNKKYETKPDDIVCTNVKTDNGDRLFQMKIKNKVVCAIAYKPYISPLMLAFDEDEDEFDFLLYLSNLLISKDSILNFIKGVNLSKL